MTIEDQVPSRELSEKLKELGYPQEGINYWILDNMKGVWQLTTLDLSTEKNIEWLSKRGDVGEKGMASVIANGMTKETLNKNGFELGDLKKAYVAPTVAEMGEWIPHNYFTIRNMVGFWFCDEKTEEYKDPIVRGEASEADARASTLIYLAENKLITFK